MAENRTGYFASPHKTAAEFTSENPILPKGVTGTESDTQKSKCGDGVTAWNSLGYNPGESVQTASTSQFKPLTIGTAGDSISLQWSEQDGKSPIWWYRNYVYPCHIDQVFSSAIGGTKSANLLAQEDEHPPQIDVFNALSEKPDLMVVHTSQNDGVLTKPEADTIFTNITTYIGLIMDAGVKNVIVAGRPPKGASGEFGSVPTIEYLNRLLAGYARETDGVYYVDVFSQWRAIPTVADSDSTVPGWRTGYTTDNTHPISKAMYETAKSLDGILNPLVQPKLIESTTALAYDDVNEPYTNVVGANGLVLGTAGKYNTVDNANVAGLSSAQGDHWTLTDENGVTATPSIEVGEDGYNYQVLTLGGTATADADIVLEKYCFAAVTLGDFKAETILYLNDVSGVDYIRYADGIRQTSSIMYDGHEFVGENKLHMTYYGELENAQWAGVSPRLTIRVNSGDSPTGTIKIGRVGVYRQG